MLTREISQTPKDLARRLESKGLVSDEPASHRLLGDIKILARSSHAKLGNRPPDVPEFVLSSFLVSLLASAMVGVPHAKHWLLGPQVLSLCEADLSPANAAPSHVGLSGRSSQNGARSHPRRDHLGHPSSPSSEVPEDAAAFLFGASIWAPVDRPPCHELQFPAQVQAHMCNQHVEGP